MTCCNFSAGPAMMPAEVVAQLQEALVDWNQSGQGVIGMSHRSQAFLDIIAESEALVRDLLQVPNDYHILWIAGGATQQFSMVPLNLPKNGEAGYLNTGYWATLAAEEAMKFRDVSLIAQGEAALLGEWTCPQGLDYLHITPNETVEGKAIQQLPEVTVPLVADMTSCLFSMPVNVADYQLLYAGSQKNLGIPGLALVLVRDMTFHKSVLPKQMAYQHYIDFDSLVNTPPTITWVAALLMLRWMARQGGVSALANKNHRQACQLYQAIDHSALFTSMVSPAFRSNINVTFSAQDEAVSQQFIQFAQQHGVFGLQGHRHVGGLRASLYTSMPDTDVAQLVSVIEAFEKYYA